MIVETEKRALNDITLLIFLFIPVFEIQKKAKAGKEAMEKVCFATFLFHIFIFKLAFLLFSCRKKTDDDEAAQAKALAEKVSFLHFISKENARERNHN